MKRLSRILNTGYGGIHATYWMFYGVATSFSSAFLLPRGYSNAEIGIILAAGNVIAVFLQPIMADIADRSRKISLIGIIQLCTVLLILLEGTLFILGHKSLALYVVFTMIAAWMTALQPLINSMSFKLAECGVHINFGISRSMGSLAYALLCAFLGTLVENLGEGVLPVTGEMVLAALLIALIIVKRNFDGAMRGKKRPALSENSVFSGDPAARAYSEMLFTGDDEPEINLWRFVCDNKLFLIMNLGVVGIYFSNAVLNGFMLQIVNDVGGGSTEMGRVLSLMAFLEIPALFFFERIKMWIPCRTILKASAVCFALKVGLIYLAKSMWLIYIAHLFQTFGFGLFLPAMVAYIDETMRKGEAVKGQAFFTAMTTVAAMISSVLGGIMLDVRDAHFMLLVSTLVTAAGALVIIIVVGKIRKQA